MVHLSDIEEYELKINKDIPIDYYIMDVLKAAALISGKVDLDTQARIEQLRIEVEDILA